MMRYLSVILSVLLLFCQVGPLAWGRPLDPATLQRHVAQQLPQPYTRAGATPATPNTNRSAGRPDNETARQQQITAALDNVRLKLEDPNLAEHVVSWEEFSYQTQQLTQKGEERVRQLQQVVIEQLKNPELKKVFYNLPYYTPRPGRPDYVQQTRGIPYIYLTDASGHGTQTILNEVIRVMRAARQANPQARILLALEFAVMLDFSSPIQFAGQKNEDFFLDEKYEPLKTLADQLNMDLLALDDVIWWQWDKDVLGYKIGDRLLAVPSDIALENCTPQQLDDVRGIVGASTWGMQRRNEQWVSYLRAVKPFYDVIIVYGGSGHLDTSNMHEFDVPVQLQEKNVVFNFYTSERDQESDEYLDRTFEQLCDANACIVVPQVDPEAQAEFSDFPEIKWDGKELMYTQNSDEETRQYISTLPEHLQQSFKTSLEQLMQAGAKEDGGGVSFDVYLPNGAQ